MNQMNIAANVQILTLPIFYIWLHYLSMEAEHQSATPPCFGAPAPQLSTHNSWTLYKYDNTPYLDIVHDYQTFFMYY